MVFIDTIEPEYAQGDVQAMYQRQRARYGYVPNYARAFCHRPELMGLWATLLAGIRRHIDPRRFELATLAAAYSLGNIPCSLAHGQALATFFSPQEVVAIARGDRDVPLDPAERALVNYARKVATDATAVTEDDIEELRSLGFRDDEVFDIAVTAAARAFFTKVLDAVGVVPDAATESMDPLLREGLVPEARREGR